MSLDLYHNMKASRGYSPPAAAQTDNTAIVSQIIGNANQAQATMFIIATGALADADATFAITLTEGDAANLSDGTAVVAADIMGDTTFTFADDDKVFLTQYIGSKRYVKCTVTPSNNTGNAPISIVAVQMGLRSSPVS